MRTHRPFRFAAALALIATLPLVAGGCGRSGARPDTPYVARDVGTLYTAAKTRLDRGIHRRRRAV